LIEEHEPCNREIENSRGWSYVTFYPEEVQANKILYDVNRLRELALDNRYYLPYEVIAQHNKVVVTAFPDGESPISPLIGLYQLISSYVGRFVDSGRYPTHGFYGKIGGIYERPEKGRVLAIYSENDEALLTIFASLEELINEFSLQGVRFELRFSNGLSALPRMLYGFDDPGYRRSGARHYKITDPELFTAVLNQAKLDYSSYPFDDEAGTPVGTG
jgi:hypothetical protein